MCIHALSSAQGKGTGLDFPVTLTITGRTAAVTPGASKSVTGQAVQQVVAETWTLTPAQVSRPHSTVVLQVGVLLPCYCPCAAVRRCLVQLIACTCSHTGT